MVYRSRIVFAILLLLSVLFVFHRADLSVAETGLIKPGDKVGIQFTCRFPNGDIAASTSSAVAADSSLRKSAVYLPRPKDDPIEVTVGQSDGKKSFPVFFLDEIIARIAPSIAGMRLGETRTMEIHSERPADIPEKEQFLELSQVRQESKEVRMTKDEYKSRTGKDPEVGADYKKDPLFPYKVTSVSENEVLIRSTLQPGTTIETGFGKGTVSEKGNQMEVVIEVAKGALIRMGPYVGRVSDIQHKMFTIDFGDPFAGEKLSCDVRTETIPENNLSKKEE